MMDELKERYLQGRMSKAEQAAFEADLTPAEKMELAAELGIKSALEDRFRNDLRNTVAGFEKNRPKTKRIKPAYISAAASMVLVASLVFYFTSTKNTQTIYNKYYSPYPNYEVTALRGNNTPSNRTQAYGAYDEGNYPLALSLFDELSVLLPADHFFQGICHLQLGQLDLALAQLNDESVVSSEYRDASRWYTALIYINQNNKEKAALILKELSDGNSEFATTAAEVLEKI